MSDKSRDAFRTISEVADWLGVQPHVLRFWESKFSQVKPVKRAGGRRYYRPNDMLLLGGIRKLLHEDGMTIKGAQKVLREHGMAHVAAMSRPLDGTGLTQDDVKDTVSELDDAPMSLDAAPETGQVVNFAQPAEPESPQVTEEPAALDAAADTSPAVEDAPSQADPAPAPLAPAPQTPAEPEPQQATMTFDDPEISTTPPDVVVVADEETAPDISVPAPDLNVAAPDIADVAEPEPAPELPPETETVSLSEPEPVADTAQDDPGIDANPPEANPLPSFMRSGASTPEPENPEPEAAGTVSSEQETPDEPAAPKPRIVDAPDPDEALIDVAPAVLSKAFAAGKLSAQQATSVTPLIAQLAALRDRMAAARGQ